MKFEVGARVRVMKAVGDYEEYARRVGQTGEVTEVYENRIGNVIEYGDYLYDVKFDDGNDVSFWSTEVELIAPPSRQDALNRLLAEHKERKAALEATVKAIQALYPLGTLVRHTKTREVYRASYVRPTLFVDLSNVRNYDRETFKITMLEFVEEGGDAK